jgi:heme oxygenase
LFDGTWASKEAETARYEVGQLGVEEGGGAFVEKVSGNFFMGLEQGSCLLQEKSGGRMVRWRGEKMQVVHR